MRERGGFVIDRAIYEHLSGSSVLASRLASYSGKAAVFNQEAPTDADPLWNEGPQYTRVVFALDVQGDPARTMGGSLAIDVQCVAGKQAPEELEPIVRRLIDGYFFTDEGCTMAAQWEDSRYFTEPVDQVCGVTLTFSLLSFPMLTTAKTDVTARVNEWTAARFPGLFVINRDTLPGIWKPDSGKCAAYWRVVTVKPAGWIPDTHQTVWRTATLRCHIFAPDICRAAEVSQEITLRLYSDGRLVEPGGSQIMVNRANSVDTGADALKVGQVTVEATFGEIIRWRSGNPLNHINYV